MESDGDGVDGQISDPFGSTKLIKQKKAPSDQNK